MCFWDFGWVAFSGAGGPYADLEVAVDETVRRGYGLIRIDALPLSTFDDDGTPRERLRFVPWPDGRARGIRWYDYRQPADVMPLDRLCELLRICRERGVQVILSSWEYQQTLSLLDRGTIAERALSVPKADRPDNLATAWTLLLGYLTDRGLIDVVAYVELHNELNASMFSDQPFPLRPAAIKSRVEQALATLQQAFPEVLFTACYTEIGPHQLGDLPDNIQVMHQHIYDWTLVEALETLIGARDGTYPSDFARAMLRPDAVPFDDYHWSAGERWREVANDAAHPDWFHFHHACQTGKFDEWVLQQWPEYQRAIRERIRNRLEAYSLEARRRDIPAYIGEGWIGWWPNESQFETTPQAEGIIRNAAHWARDLGFRGTILSSNFAPHHPEWNKVTYELDLNTELTAKGNSTSDPRPPTNPAEV